MPLSTRSSQAIEHPRTANRHRSGIDRSAASLTLALAVALSSGFASCATAPTPRPRDGEAAAPSGAVPLERVHRGAYPGGTLVRLGTGFLGGFEDEAGSLAWLGIPYAAPPVGNLRWRAPAPLEPWDGVREALSFGPGAVRFLPGLDSLEGSEDCLRLNVWRPDDARAGLPVIFWIHGGANTAGTASAPDHGGHAIASSQGVVFVSVEYRLGPLGWFRDPALLPADASAAESSGNFGLLDIIAALRWVRDEIASFGGDPGRVTIMGESAGGLDVLALLLAPEAEGLFSGAVAMSPIFPTATAEEADARAEKLLADLIIRDESMSNRGYEERPRAVREALAMPPSERAAYLRSVHPWTLYAPLSGGRTGMFDWPSAVPDGRLLPLDGFARYASGDYPGKVPLIIGSTRDEVGAFLALEPGIASLDPSYGPAMRYGSELWRARYVDGVARAIAARPGGGRVYSYRFDWGSSASDGRSELPFGLGSRLGAFHSLDVPFFLGTDVILGPVLGRLVLTRDNAPSRRAVSSLILAYLGAFARTGNPNAEGASLEWPEYGASGGKWIALGNPDARGPGIVMEGGRSEDEIAAEMLAELGEKRAMRAMALLPFFMRGFPFQDR